MSIYKINKDAWDTYQEKASRILVDRFPDLESKEAFITYTQDEDSTYVVVRIYYTKSNGGQGAIADGCVDQLPGCCGVGIVSDIHVWSHFRGAGFGHLMTRLLVDACKGMGYTGILCTDVLTNAPQQRIFEKEDFQRVFSFTNRKTGNPVLGVFKSV